jgi:hypothetical protein
MAPPTSTLALDLLPFLPDLPPEMWAFVAKRRGVVGAWQLMSVCSASRAGAKEFLSTLPGLVVCGGAAGRPRDV